MSNKLNSEYWCPEDQQCVEQLLKLKKCNATDDPVTSCQNYLHRVLKALNEYTKQWELSWTCDSMCMFDNAYNEKDDITFSTHVKWPMEHVMPLDLVPEVQKLLRRMSWNERFKCNMVEKIEIDYNRDTRMLSFSCNCAFGLLELVKCENCGNCWDGNAQCMCHLDMSLQ